MRKTSIILFLAPCPSLYGSSTIISIHRLYKIKWNNIFSSSDEDTDIKALVMAWLKSLPGDNDKLEMWLNDYFYRALEWVTKNGEYVIDTTLVGVAMNGLSHLVGMTCKSEFICGLSRGLGGNLRIEAREKLAKDIFQWANEVHSDSRKPLNTYYDLDTKRLCSYQLQVSPQLKK